MLLRSLSQEEAVRQKGKEGYVSLQSSSMNEQPKTVEASKKEVLHPEESITTLLLIRHGHTRMTEEGRLYSDPEAELTDEGLKQSKALAEWLMSRPPDVVLSSTAKRVVATAESISGQTNIPILRVEDLNEWHVGNWEGRTYLDLKKNSPDEYKAWTADPIRMRPPGGESIEDMYERTKSRIAEIIEQYDGKRVALVTHAGIVRSVLVHALGMPLDNFWRISIPVGTVSKVDFSKSFATVHFMAMRPGADEV